MPPQGIAYLSEYLKSKNIKVKVFDLNIDLYRSLSNEFLDLWTFENHPKWVDPTKFDKIKKIFKKKIKDYSDLLIENSDILCFSLNAGNRLFTLDLVSEIRKKSNKTIIFGGHAVKENTEMIPKELVDYFILEKPFSTLIEFVRARKGNLYSRFNLLKKNKLLSVKRALNFGRVFPKYKEFNLKMYDEATLPITISNKCKFNCVFCDYNALTPNFISREAEEVFKEVKYHVEKNNINNFTFTDPTLNNDIKKLEKFCNLVIESRLNISWNAQMSPINGMSSKLFKKIKKAGGTNPMGEVGYGIKGGFITFGVESGSDRILELMGKPFRIKDAEETLRNCHDAGINTLINIIVGFPGETREDFKKTKEFLLRNSKNIDFVSNISSFYIPIKSKIYRKLEALKIKNPEGGFLWEDDKGNCPEERRQKIKEIKQVLNKANIKYMVSNEGYV